jgi:hypothetical protein
MIETHNWAAEARARETAKARGTLSTRAATRPFAAGNTLSFTADELNAFFQKWSPPAKWDPQVRRYISDPVLILHDERLILAGTVTNLGAVVSLHFEPMLDEKGMLHLQLRRVLAGKLPLPSSLWEGQRQRLADSVKGKLPNFQRLARMDSTSGATNGAGVAAAMTKLLLSVLSDQPADPVVFLPLDDKRGLPAKLTAVRIADGALNLTVEAITPREREEFLARIREPYTSETAMGR